MPEHETDGKDVATSTAPDPGERVVRATVHGRPGAAIIVQNRAPVAYGEDITVATAPHAIEHV